MEKFDIPPGRCQVCGSTWFLLVSASVQKEFYAGLVSIDFYGNISSHKGQLVCVDCQEIYDHEEACKVLRLVPEKTEEEE